MSRPPRSAATSSGYLAPRRPTWACEPASNTSPGSTTSVKSGHVGERVADVTSAPGFAGTARTVAAYYDFQHDPAVHDTVTYVDDEGERSHLSFIVPRSKDDLRRRAAAFAAWAEYSGGQLGRAPDYMNAAVMALAAAHEHWSQNGRLISAGTPLDMYDRCRREDVCLTHTLVTPQIDRKTPLGEQEPYLNAGVVRRTESGIIVARQPRARHARAVLRRQRFRSGCRS